MEEYYVIPVHLLKDEDDELSCYNVHCTGDHDLKCEHCICEHNQEHSLIIEAAMARRKIKC